MKYITEGLFPTLVFKILNVSQESLDHPVTRELSVIIL